MAKIKQVGGVDNIQDHPHWQNVFTYKFACQSAMYQGSYGFSSLFSLTSFLLFGSSSTTYRVWIIYWSELGSYGIIKNINGLWNNDTHFAGNNNKNKKTVDQKLLHLEMQFFACIFLWSLGSLSPKEFVIRAIMRSLEYFCHPMYFEVFYMICKVNGCTQRCNFMHEFYFGL